MIPHRLHRVWLGDAEIPPTCERYWDRFALLYPDWERHTWRKVASPRITGDLIERCPNVGAASDIARLEILYRFGGIYADTDVEPLDSCPCWVRCFECWAGKQNSGAGNYLIGCTPEHPAIRQLLVNIAANIGRIMRLDPDKTNHVTGPDMVSRTFGTLSSASLIERPLIDQSWTHHSMRAWRGPRLSQLCGCTN